MRSVGRDVHKAGVLLAVTLAAPGARAQIPRAGRDAFQVQARLDVLGQYLRAQPAVTVTDESEQGVGRVATRVPVAMLGFGGGLDLVLRDRLVLPMVTVNLLFTVGSYPTVYGTSDGRVIAVHPWESSQIEMLFGGIGVRGKHRRWAWGVSGQPGLSASHVEVQRPDEDGARRMLGLHVLVRATAEGCRRLDPETRVCLFGGPNAYLDGWLNGGVMGVRLEYGP